MSDGSGPTPALGDLFDDEETDGAWLDRVAQAVTPPNLGDLFGYRLVRVAHRGGQGTVFEAREPRTGRRVAIKHLAEGEDTLDLRRRRETEALATLNHRNVVSLLAAPAEGGILVMEWIEGQRLDEWADGLFRDLPRPEAIRRVVEALVGVAAGVAAAHARGVLHRDLKPSNVLVEADGTPKVLDFGLATAIDPDAERTISRSFTGTPAWSSPEQVASGPAGVDARSDVHGLGLLLYRAIAGRTAFDANRPIAEIFDEVREFVPSPPSRHRPGVPRELDLIAARALEKEPARRYPTAEEFRRDLQRFLDGEPVEAHPPHPAYLARKFIRRHPGATAGVALAGLATLVGTAATARFAVDAGRSRDEALVRTAEAERARNSAERMNGLLVDLIGRAREREAAGDPAGVQGILLAAAESLKRDPPPAEAEVDLQATIATALAEIGEVERSLPHFDRAEELLVASDRERETVALLLRRSEAETRQFTHEAAFRSAARAAEVADRLGLPSGERAQATSRLSYTLSEVGRHEEGFAAAERAMVLAEEANAEVQASVHARFGLALNRNGRLPEAIAAARRSVELAESDGAVPAMTRARCLYNLGFLLIGDGRCGEAIDPLRQALELRIRGYGEVHSSNVPSRAMLATALRQCGRFDEAIAALEPALPALKGDGPVAAGERARINRELGKVHLARGGSGDADLAVVRLEAALADLVRLGSGNLRRFQLVVPPLIDAIERRDGRPAAMRAAVSLGDRFAGGPGDPLITTAIRTAAIDRLAAAPASEWPEGPPVATVRGDLDRLADSLGPEAIETLECELVLARLLAASEDPAERAEATERAEALSARAGSVGRVADGVARVAGQIAAP